MPEVLSILAALCSAVACVLVWRMSSSIGASRGSDPALDRIKDKLDAQDAQLRDEFAQNRKETAELAQAQREELRNNLAAFEKHLDEDAKAQQEALRQQFSDLLKQLDGQARPVWTR